MSKKYFLALILIALSLQLVILNYFKIFNTRPDLFLILVVLASLVFKFSWAIFFSIAIGLLKDVFATGAFGINTALFLLWAFLIRELSRKIPLDNKYLCAALIFVVSLMQNIAMRLVFAYSGKFIPPGLFLRVLFLESLYTAGVWLLVFRLVKPAFNP